jgi:hypothetical protein
MLLLLLSYFIWQPYFFLSLHARDTFTDHNGAKRIYHAENLTVIAPVYTLSFFGSICGMHMSLLFFRNYGEEVSRRNKTTGA